VCFLAIVVWVMDRRKTQAFEQAAQLPFLGD
jgi:cbb3-type cytochrome oxidase subunit 3